LASPGVISWFSDHFVTQWLRLKNLDLSPPDEKKFATFYRRGVKASIIGEPIHFFQHLLTNNLPAAALIDSDFSMVNDTLSHFYRIKGVTAYEFTPIKLDRRSGRGGLLGMAAVQTASANGVDTSPINRGIYILDHILGTPPPGPPEGVDIPSPDVRDALTLRETLKKHRTDQTCNRCHAKIDPLGFALENFDAVGMPRSKYKNGKRIDTSGQMPGGKEIRGLVDLKAELLNQTDQVADNLVRKLLEYTTGRSLGPADHREVHRICNHLKLKQYRLKDMLVAVLNSKIFLNK
jgi:hypothetical protein